MLPAPGLIYIGLRGKPKLVPPTPLSMSTVVFRCFLSPVHLIPLVWPASTTAVNSRLSTTVRTTDATYLTIDYPNMTLSIMNIMTGVMNMLLYNYGRVPLLVRAHPKTRTTRPTASRPPPGLLPLVTDPSIRPRGHLYRNGSPLGITLHCMALVAPFRPMGTTGHAEVRYLFQVVFC